MKCVIIASGNLEINDNVKTIICSAQLIICADGGARHLRALQIRPDVLIGDLDSITPEDRDYFQKNNIKTIRYPEKKDRTDTQICVEYAMEQNVTDITLLGATGSRMDHTLANIFMLKEPAQKGISVRLTDRNNDLYIVTSSLALKGKKGDLLSVLPLTRQVKGVTLEGVEYPLKNAQISLGSSIGISNVFVDHTVRISLEQGILIVTKSKD